METNPFESPKARPERDRTARAPLRLGSVLERSFRAIAERPIVFLVILLTQMGSGLANRALQGDTPPGTLNAAQWLLVLVSYAIVAWALGAAVGAAEGRSTSVALSAPLARLPVAFLCFILYFLMVMFGMIFLIIPGIYVAVRFAFAPVIAASGRSGLDGFKLSSDLVRGRFWTILGYMVVSVLPIFATMGLNFAISGFDPMAMAELPFALTLLGAIVYVWQLSFFAVLFLAAEVTDAPAAT